MSTLSMPASSNYSDSYCEQAGSNAVGRGADTGRLQLVRRLAVLDRLDALFGEFDGLPATTAPEPENVAFAMALKDRLVAANEVLYEKARHEISSGQDPQMLGEWISGSVNQAGISNPGLGFDFRDEIVSGVLAFREPTGDEPAFSPEMTPYQPTPVRHILDIVSKCKLTDDDVLVDLGSGLGHVPLLVSIFTGIRTVGVELQPALVASAREAASRLNLERVRFIAEDARGADLSIGTVFYLFSPFKGSMLTHVLQRLRGESKSRPIRVCSLGPCTPVLQEQAWLRAVALPEAGRIALFEVR